MSAIVKWKPQINQVYCMDIFALCDTLDDQSVDMIFADLPYGVTACAWDVRIPFDPMWKAFRRVIKPRGAMVFTASQPFTSMLVMSNLKDFRYEWVWNKVLSTGFLDANKRPMLQHESIIIFAESLTRYYPQMLVGDPYNKGQGIKKPQVYGFFERFNTVNTGTRYPKTIIEFSNADKTNGLHPTQKPIALLEYLIQTYTRPGDTILDPVCGSGTTGIAARNTGRNFIIGDSSPEYVEVARKRLSQPFTLPMFETLGVAV